MPITCDLFVFFFRWLGVPPKYDVPEGDAHAHKIASMTEAKARTYAVGFLSSFGTRKIADNAKIQIVTE